MKCHSQSWTRAPPELCSASLLPLLTFTSCSQTHLLGHPPCSNTGQGSLGRAENGLPSLQRSGCPGYPQGCWDAVCTWHCMLIQASLCVCSEESIPATAHMALIARTMNVWEGGGFFQPYRVVYSSDNLIFIQFAEILDLVQVTLGIFPAWGIVVVLFSL